VGQFRFGYFIAETDDWSICYDGYQRKTKLGMCYIKAIQNLFIGLPVLALLTEVGFKQPNVLEVI
jgi:hypothetical protein